MSDKDKQDAKELAARAAHQGQDAVMNAGKAAKAAAPVVAETAGDAAEKLNDRTEEAVNASVKGIRKFAPRVLSHLSSDTSVGFLALSVALYAGAIAFSKFGAVFSKDGEVMDVSVDTPPLRPVA